MKRLADEYGIETRPFFVPMHYLPMYASDQHFPVAESLAAHGVNFPTYSGLSDSDLREICIGLDSVIRTTI
jgi:perosamine synthetase